MPIALVRPPGPALDRCALTYLKRAPIDIIAAQAQHAEYVRTLTGLGCRVQGLPESSLPDAVFVEDTAVVLDELAILARPGEPTRRPEVDDVEAALAEYRPVARIRPPGTLDGGDVLQVGRTLFVGTSRRTNGPGQAMLRALVAPLGYAVRSVPLYDCLHLKSAASTVADRTLLVNPAWVAPGVFEGFETLIVDRGEPFAANVLRVADALLMPAEHERTRARLEQRGIPVSPVPFAELMKAEAGVTCCCLLVHS